MLGKKQNFLPLMTHEETARLVIQTLKRNQKEDVEEIGSSPLGTFLVPIVMKAFRSNVTFLFNLLQFHLHTSSSLGLERQHNLIAKKLCGQGYSSMTLQLITGDNSSGSEATTNATARDLNNPSFAHLCPHIKLPSYPRQKLNIQVKPSILSFTLMGTKAHICAHG